MAEHGGGEIIQRLIDKAKGSPTMTDSPTPSEPRTPTAVAFLETVSRAVLDPSVAALFGDEGKPVLLALVSPDAIRDAIVAIEAEAAEPAALDVARLAQAIQSTILTSPDKYMGPGMGAYRTAWTDLTDKQKWHVMHDAAALAAEYARIQSSDA